MHISITENILHCSKHLKSVFKLPENFSLVFFKLVLYICSNFFLSLTSCNHKQTHTVSLFLNTLKSWVLLLGVGRAVLQKNHQCHHTSKPGKALLPVQPKERKHYMQVRLIWAVILSRIHSLTWKDCVASSKNHPLFWEQINSLLT